MVVTVNHDHVTCARATDPTWIFQISPYGLHVAAASVKYLEQIDINLYIY